ncbi:MAG TPA: xanthine dehydrogenase family protein subunit M, partial [Verrucomicrobiae bacterium]|nr:xanthine dehydrogenase family protein subunit M [Verrucomicrobiae bacterium]
TLLDLAKCGVAEPDKVVDITHLKGLDAISVNAEGAVIGALAKMSRVAEDSGIKGQFPAVSEALWQAASAQIRNMASMGGNLMQRTRCAYFRDPATFPACNKRNPGSGCSAMGGVNRGHAVLGISDSCIATYPGDLAAALTAFDAVVHLGERRIAVDDFFLLPGTTPEREHAIEPGELITAISIPASPAARRSTYLKIRDRQSYEFAAASAAVGLELEADGKTIRDLRVALGGVATKPWRARAVEDALRGKVLEPQAVKRASLLAVEGAVDHGANRYKIDLVPRVVARAIQKLGESA